MTMSLTRLSRVAVPAALAVIALAACQSPTSSATTPSAPAATTKAAATTNTPTPTPTPTLKGQELLDKSKTAALAATSVHLKGSIVDSGSTMALDFNGATDGSNGSYSITQGDQQVTILRIGADGYLKANAAFWKRNAGGVDTTKVVDKWVKSPSLVAKMKDFTTASLLTSMYKDVKVDAEVKTDTVDGAAVYVLTDSTSASPGKLMLDAKTYLPVKLTGVDAKGTSGEVTFTDWNKAPAPQAPPAAEVVTVP